MFPMSIKLYRDMCSIVFLILKASERWYMNKRLAAWYEGGIVGGGRGGWWQGWVSRATDGVCRDFGGRGVVCHISRLSSESSRTADGTVRRRLCGGKGTGMEDVSCIGRHEKDARVDKQCGDQRLFRRTRCGRAHGNVSERERGAVGRLPLC